MKNVWFLFAKDEVTNYIVDFRCLTSVVGDYPSTTSIADFSNKHPRRNIVVRQSCRLTDEECDFLNSEGKYTKSVPCETGNLPF